MHINNNIGVGTRGERGWLFSTNIKSVGEGTEVLKFVLLHRNTLTLIVFDYCRKNRITHKTFTFPDIEDNTVI